MLLTECFSHIDWHLEAYVDITSYLPCPTAHRLFSGLAVVFAEDIADTKANNPVPSKSPPYPCADAQVKGVLQAHGLSSARHGTICLRMSSRRRPIIFIGIMVVFLLQSLGVW
jgi:hypothetical protein